jgi:hypothetical protein
MHQPVLQICWINVFFMPTGVDLRIDAPVYLKEKGTAFTNLPKAYTIRWFIS